MQEISKNYFSKENKEKWSTLKNKKILILNTQWNTNIVNSLTKSAIKLLEFANVKYQVITVPGAYEIPFAIKKLIDKYDGFIALGCLIKGDTYHFEAISYGVINEISRLMVDNEKPISFGILMVKKLKDAENRSKNDSNNKGLECAARNFRYAWFIKINKNYE